MLFQYKAIDKEGSEKNGTIEAISVDVAINALQRRGFILSSIDRVDEQKGILGKTTSFFERISGKDIVMISRQMSTLFSAQVSALRVFRLIAGEAGKPKLTQKLNDVAEAIQGGMTISGALARHSDIFSDFYISMVKSGEESGRLDETFMFLADYLERSYEVNAKAKNALIYPAFVMFTFVVVMGLMLTLVIPKISSILTESGQEIPVYTQVVIGLSNLLLNYGVFVLIALIVGVFFLIKFSRTAIGALQLDQIKLEVPLIGSLYQRLYMSRFADTMNTMLKSGIPMVKALELCSSTIDNHVYKKAMENVIENVKGGSTLSDALSRHPDLFTGILVQMSKVGEESGNLGEILGTLSKFYQREVIQTVDALVGLIEPMMIIVLALGVGVLLAAVLIPIYNITAAF